MSETHCNRRRRQSEQSDDLSDSTIDQQNTTTINKEIENSDAPNEGQHESEYDTAGSDEEEEVDNDDNVAAGIKNKDAVSKQDGGDDDDVQRESGDGQEEEEEEEDDDEDKPAKKLDDDEDRRNPQYIPKRGTFYEHDDRTMEEEMKEGGSTVEPIVEREVKEKKVWKDKEDKWDHDRYNQDEQAPKSHDELIAVYGYDIRNEEGPPRARRRRRYGRGPNKYTRNWEDEDAYGKSLGGGGGNNTQTSLQKTRRSNNKNGEEFPALKATINTTGNDTIDMPIEEPIISSSAWYSNKNKNQTKQQMFPPLQSQQQHEQIQKSKLFDGANNIKLNENNKTPSEPTNPAWKKDFKYTNDNNYAPIDATIDKMPLIKQNNQQHNNYNYNNHHQGNNKRQVQESVSLAASRARGRGFKPNVNNNLMANKTILETKPKGRGAGLITTTTTVTTSTIDSNHRRSNQHHHHDDQQQQQIINDIKHMNINNDGIYHHSTRQNKNFYSQQRPPSNVQPMQQRIQQQLPSQQQQQPLPDVVANRPKRYSSLRQRSAMSDGPGQQAYSQQPHNQHAQHGFYSPQAGNSHGVLKSQGFPQSHYDQASPVPTAGSAAAAAAVAPSLAGQGVISLPPPPPGGQQSGGYAPPPFLVPSPQFIPPPPQTAPPSLINYVAAPNGATFTPNFQGYQSYNPTVQPQGPPAPPPELYQPQGCTYYSPAQQSHHHHHHHHQQQQVVPVRRPKAAIPILPPPENSQHHQIQRGRGRPVTNYQNNSNNNSIQQIQDDVHNVSQVSEKNEIFENAESELIVGEKKDKVDSVVGLEKNVEQQQAIVDTENVLKDKVVDEEKSIKGNVIEEEKQLNSKVIVDDEKVNDLSKVESSNDEDNKKELIKSVVDIDNVEISSSTNETEVAKVVDENNVVEETAA